ncbi:MAG: ROK family protein [Deltaproteobacteria bacterium]|nr:ROK family protein [Deltaproteobacteria bacterium]
MKAIGVEIGGGHIAAAVIDTGTGAVDGFESAAHAGKDVGAIVEVLGRMVAARGEMRVGIGLAAQLARDASGDVSVRVAPSLGWRDFAFDAAVAARIGRKPRTVNDLSAVAFGEWRFGAGRGTVGPFYCVYIGSGIGSALIVDGAVYDGASGVAGELGHTKVKPGGEPCGCGQRGCLEAYVGGLALARLSQGKTASQIEAAAGRGESWAVPIWGAVCRELPIALANVVAILNPATLCVGGGVIDHTERLFDTCAAGVRAFAPSVATASLAIAKSELGARAGVIGAACLAASK